MIEKKTVTVPARDVQRVARVICDLCGFRSETATREVGGGIIWKGGSRGYDREVVTISLRSSMEYPETGWGKTTSFHVCPSCFQDRVIPMFSEAGALRQTEEWDW